MIWALDGFRLSRLDGDGQVQSTLTIEHPLQRDSAQLVVGARAVWVAAGHALLYRIDRDRLTKTLDVGYHLDGLAATDDALFVSNDRWGGRLIRIDPDDNRIDLAVGFHPRRLVFGGGALWVAWKNTVTRVDPESLEAQASFDLGGYVSEMSHGAGALWAMTLDLDTAGSENERSRLWRIDADPEEVAQFRDRPMIAAGDALWIDDGALCRFDGQLTRHPDIRLQPFFERDGEVWGLDGQGRVARFRDGRLESFATRAQVIAAG